MLLLKEEEEEEEEEGASGSLCISRSTLLLTRFARL
jgi:hypothetical protein